MENLLSLLHSYEPMSADLEGYLRSIITCRHVPKGEILLRKGQVARDIFFIEKGLVRSFHYINEREVSNWFMKEGDICVSVVSFFRQRPSVDIIKALEDCEIWGISYQQLQKVYVLFPEFNKHGFLITSEYYMRSEQRHQDIKRRSASANYAKLIEGDPDLVRRVPYIHLASFLDVSKTTFARIRAEYAKEKREFSEEK